jgi:predicted DNA-binding transcriptional regulator AlpA
MAPQRIDQSEEIPKILWNKSEVADAIGVSARTIDNLVKTGNFPSGVRLGRYLLWSKSTINTWQHRLFDAQEGWRPRV